MVQAGFGSFLPVIEEITKQFRLSLDVDEERGSILIGGSFCIFSPNTSENDSPLWALSSVATIAGCRTLRNGDPGNPDETEVRELGSYGSPKEAFADAIRLHVGAMWDEISLSHQRARCDPEPAI